MTAQRDRGGWRDAYSALTANKKQIAAIRKPTLATSIKNGMGCPVNRCPIYKDDGQATFPPTFQNFSLFT